MPKYSPRYHKPQEIEFKNHWAIGTQWEVPGSKGNTYTVEFTEKGFTCDCWGMRMHGKCKHTRNLTEKWIQED